MSRKNKIADSTNKAMCDCKVMIDLITEFPKTYSPSDAELIRLVIDSGHNNEAAEIVLDDQADAGICCQHFIDFYENHFMSYMFRNMSVQERESMEGPLSKALEMMSDTNCASFFKTKPMLEYKAKLDNNEKEWKARADSRLVNSALWMIQEFERCLSGDDFDFTDYTTE